MKIGILGAGAIASGAAAYLAQNGHEPTLWSPSGRRLGGLGEGVPLTAKGGIEGTFAVSVAASAAEAVSGKDAVLVALPANGHRMVLDAVAPYLSNGQPVIFSSHASFGALYLSRLLAARGVSVPMIVWGTTLTTGRMAGDEAVNVSTLRKKIDYATLGAWDGDSAIRLLTELFGDRFVPRDGLMAIALSNLNPQNHLGIALLNLTRMEKGETWGQAEHVTPAVGRFIEALDAERLAIAESFGLSVRTVRQHFSLSFHVPENDVSTMNQEMFRNGHVTSGPSTMDSRYIYEDVPFGLYPTALLGRVVGRPATLHEAGIAIFSAAAGRDLTADNDLLPALDFATLDRERLEALARSGY
ncbi:NAD/NADP octopine/nopaline dehydrogenase [Aureimonas altamirensis]|uniref:2-dehydropantoate 2-reductase n=1 Tax=Aureimonas altamirensis TaxID=370622 RepID=A0A0B1Q4C5_9HYPH|nr:NAD/NADP octopine/nopaline dehydrogenase family protein [Aureimonas altamirensis]KHJ55244.1 NAD/NADP octopine/nopaline dehydrogenase [Aureimonas altamirensis]